MNEIEKLRLLMANNKGDDAENVRLCRLGERLLDVMSSYPFVSRSSAARTSFYEGLLNELNKIHQELRSFGYGVKEITSREYYPTQEVGNLYDTIFLLTEQETREVTSLWLDEIRRRY